MPCPHCLSTSVSKRKLRTLLGYRTFCCRDCIRRFNERSGTPFNDLQFPIDIVLLAVLWRLRYKLGFRDVAELLLERGFEVSYETIRVWSSGLHRWSARIFVLNGVVEQVAPGIWTRLTSRSVVVGDISTEP
jgi:transposase-like protein